MKYKIKENLRSQIIVLVFVLVLLITAIFMLVASKSTMEQVPSTVVPGTLVLDTGKAVEMGNGKLEITLLSSNVSPPQCADCMEQARIQVKQGEETVRLNFRFGGIAGFHDDTAQAFGYTFIVRELKKDSVVLEYKRN